MRALWPIALAACASEVAPLADGGHLDAQPVDAGQADAASMDARAEDCPTAKSYVQIPMRDGKSLHASVERSVNPACKRPTVLVQTPYNIENHDALFLGPERASFPLFASPHYNFVAVDWRGSFGSRAAAVMPPQPHGSDGYDLVEWIAAQPWSDGKVGTWGVSALCVQQYRTAAAQPPHLVAAVPIFCAMNTDYAQVYPGGVMRREYVEMLDGLGFGVKALYEMHPTFDAFWSVVGGALLPDRIRVPMLVVAGWYDLSPLGSLASFDGLARSGTAVAAQHRLLVGPWHHFAAGGETGALRDLSAEELVYSDAARRIQRDSLAFFDLHLRGLDGEAARWAPVRYALEAEVLEPTSAWPFPGTREETLFLAPGALVPVAPTATSTTFVYDPNDPSPTRGGGTLAPNLAHGPAAQDDVLARDDHLVFVSAPFPAERVLLGPLEVHLEVATSGADTDFAVRITAVDAGGRHLLIGEGIRRLSLRDGYSRKSPVARGARYPLRVGLTAELGRRLPAGARLGLVLSSANFPRFDRNPNDGSDFFAGARPERVTNTVFLGAARVVFQVR